MRTIERLTRRGLLVRGLSWLAALAAEAVSRPVRVRADIGDFAGTDWVGKTRAGRYRKFYINYWKPMRRIDPESWRLEVTGRVRQPAVFRRDDLLEFPTRTQSSRLKCVECWSARADWNGFAASELERRVRPLPDARGVVFHCADEYKEYLSREALNDSRTLLVHTINGEPLTDEHGFPLRVIIPFKYGYKNPKAILKMEYVAEPRPGTWSRIGPYSRDGTILPGTDHPLEFDKEPRRIFGGAITQY